VVLLSLLSFWRHSDTWMFKFNYCSYFSSLSCCVPHAFMYFASLAIFFWAFRRQPRSFRSVHFRCSTLFLTMKLWIVTQPRIFFDLLVQVATENRPTVLSVFLRVCDWSSSDPSARIPASLPRKLNYSVFLLVESSPQPPKKNEPTRRHTRLCIVPGVSGCGPN
jgi:hypothetical protein